MKLTHLLLLLLFTVSIQAQEKLVIGQSKKVKYEPELTKQGIDSIVFISLPGAPSQCEDIEVFYDTLYTNLAFKSYSEEDYCHTFNFWRSGQLKTHTIYTINEYGVPVWWWDENYCSNGQLIFKGPSPNQPQLKRYTTYNCDGQKIIEFDHQDWGAVGEIRFWYPNGQLKWLQNFENNQEEGEWKYFDEEGTLLKTEIYKDGELIDSK